MTVQMFHPTADPFDIASTFPARFGRTASSTLNVDVLQDTIREVLKAWDSLAIRVRTPTGVDERATAVGTVSDRASLNVTLQGHARPVPAKTLEAVDYVADLLNVSQQTVLRSCGIAERTYFGWKTNPRSKPRPASEGSLWATVNTLIYLVKVNPAFATWFQSTPEAREAFEGGQLNRVVQLEMEHAAAVARATGQRPLTSAGVSIPSFGDHVDEVVVDSTDVPPRPRAGSRRVARSPMPRLAAEDV